jgi:hypothetical protein
MRRLLRVIGWALVGSAVAGGLACAGFLAFNGSEILGPHDADEVQAWARFAAATVSLGCAGVGFVVGGIYGLARGRSGRRGSNATPP